MALRRTAGFQYFLSKEMSTGKTIFLKIKDKMFFKYKHFVYFCPSF